MHFLAVTIKCVTSFFTAALLLCQHLHFNPEFTRNYNLYLKCSSKVKGTICVWIITKQLAGFMLYLRAQPFGHTQLCTVPCAFLPTAAGAGGAASPDTWFGFRGCWAVRTNHTQHGSNCFHVRGLPCSGLSIPSGLAEFRSCFSEKFSLKQVPFPAGSWGSAPSPQGAERQHGSVFFFSFNYFFFPIRTTN